MPLDKFPCKEHQTAFYAVASFYCAVCIVMVSYMVSNDRRAQAAEIALSGELSDAKLVAKKEHADMMEKVITKINDNNEKVIQRLSHIEAKLP